jgi:hypothetical protein
MLTRKIGPDNIHNCYVDIQTTIWEQNGFAPPERS